MVLNSPSPPLSGAQPPHVETAFFSILLHPKPSLSPARHPITSRITTTRRRPTLYLVSCCLRTLARSVVVLSPTSISSSLTESPIQHLATQVPRLRHALNGTRHRVARPLLETPCLLGLPRHLSTSIQRFLAKLECCAPTTPLSYSSCFASLHLANRRFLQQTLQLVPRIPYSVVKTPTLQPQASSS